jgi:hypothetical protein
MIMRRVLKLIQHHFPDTHILVRGDGHFSGPELMGLIDSMPNTDFIFGFSSNVKLKVLAEPACLRACDLWVSVQAQGEVPNAVRLFDEFDYRAGSWTRAWRVLLKAEVMALGENPRFVVTSLAGVDAGTLYEDIYCARGQSENYIKHLKGDLAADRTSCTSFLANCMRLLMHAAAYVLHQQLRTLALQHTALSQAQPSTVIAKLFKQTVQKQDRPASAKCMPGQRSVADTDRTTIFANASKNRQLFLIRPRPVRRESTANPLPPKPHTALNRPTANG